MSATADFVTIFRSMDDNAKEDCETIVDLLSEEGITAAVLDDSAAGVPQGTYEVRVPRAVAARADKAIKANPLPDDAERGDDSHALDLETVFHAEGSEPAAEFEASSVKGLLEANGIAAVVFGDSVLPNLPFEVKVARKHAQRARRLMADAERDAKQPEHELNP